jgi:hypothetical protein
MSCRFQKSNAATHETDNMIAELRSHAPASSNTL